MDLFKMKSNALMTISRSIIQEYDHERSSKGVGTRPSVGKRCFKTHEKSCQWFRRQSAFLVWNCLFYVPYFNASFPSCLQLLSDARSVPFGKEKDKEGRSATPGQSTEARKGRELSERFVRMRNICKQATITIPPSVYRKDCNDNDMEAAILELLKKNGLDEKSQKSSIMAVKEKLQLQRDLDGIDTSNIIDDGPRSRRRAVRYVLSLQLIRWICDLSIPGLSCQFVDMSKKIPSLKEKRILVGKRSQMITYHLKETPATKVVKKFL